MKDDKYIFDTSALLCFIGGNEGVNDSEVSNFVCRFDCCCFCYFPKKAILLHKAPEFDSINEKIQMITLPNKRKIHENSMEYQ